MKLITWLFLILGSVALSSCATKSGGGKSASGSLYGDESADSDDVVYQPDEAQKDRVEKEYDALEAAHKRNDSQGVLRAASRVLANKPNDAKALNSIAAEYIRQGKTDLAKLALQKAFEKNPEVSALHSNLGIIHLREGDKRRAIQSFKRALQIDNRNIAASANLGALYAYYRDYGRALPLLENAYSNLKDKTAVANNYAIALRGTGDTSRAQKIYEDILKRDSRNSEATYNYAILLIDYLDKPSDGMALLSKLEFLGIGLEMQPKVDQLRLKARSRPK